MTNINDPFVVNIDHNNCFYSEYFFPEEDFSNSWKMHNGLTGHIRSQERKNLHEDLVRETLMRLQALNELPEKRSHINTLVAIASILTPDLGGVADNRIQEALNNHTMGYHLISGYSRSGGTYVLSEYAKMRNIDVLSKHFYWSHDFFPYFKRHDLFSQHRCRDDILLYISTLIASILRNNESHFFPSYHNGNSIDPAFSKTRSRSQNRPNLETLHT